MPLIAVARKLRAKVPDVELLFVGPKGAMEKKIMAAENIRCRYLMSGKIRRYMSSLNFIDFFRIIIGCFQALWILLWDLPDAIFSKGGYASIPVVLISAIYRIPVLIHESDSVPGITNKILGKFAERVALAYKEASKFFPPSQFVITGNPLRDEVLNGDPEKARQKFSLNRDKKVLFIYGGSQGAKIINEGIIRILKKLLVDYQIIHQTGESNYDEVRHKVGEFGIKAGHEGYYPVPFIEEGLNDIFAVADLVIARAGANTISEIAANGKASIIIPIESSANNHQRMNAYALAKIGACMVLDENNLGEHLFFNAIEQIMTDESVRNKLTSNIKVFYHPNAADTIAEGIIGLTE